MTNLQVLLWDALKNARRVVGDLGVSLECVGIDPDSDVCDICGGPCMEGSVRCEDSDICAECNSEEPDE